MENNKAYLQKLPWVFLIAVASVLSMLYFEPWTRQFDKTIAYLSVSFLNSLLMFSALGLATSKWKEAMITFAIMLAMYAIEGFIVGDGFNFSIRLITYFLYPLPIFIFVGMQTAWKKAWLVYLFAFLLFVGASAGFYSTTGLILAVEGLTYRPTYFMQTLLFFSAKAGFFIFQVIIVCEIINYAKGKTFTSKSTLLNLGNDYNRLSSIVTFWALKLSMLTIIVGGGANLYAFVRLMNSSYRYSYLITEIDPNINLFYQIIMPLYMLGYVAMAFFFAWYFRKFLLENFISYGVQSKFLYWLSIIPIIGFLAFLILQIDNKRQEGYSKKLTSLERFAAGSTAAVTTVFIILIVIRLIMRLSGGDKAFILTLSISILLFIWVITSKIGYYVSLALIGIGLLGLIVVSTVMTMTNDSLVEVFAIFFGLLLLNLVQLVFIYPIYHFEEFQYIPGEDPDAKPAGAVTIA
jgi:hypothetical protein